MGIQRRETQHFQRKTLHQRVQQLCENQEERIHREEQYRIRTAVFNGAPTTSQMTQDVLVELAQEFRDWFQTQL